MMQVLTQVWPFVNPALAAAAAATGLIPILLHWFNRRRYRRRPWAAMMFLRAAHERSVTRLWLERWLILLLRVAVIILLGLAVARPIFPASRFVPLPATRSHRIIVIDDSLSMRAGDAQGRSRFERARRAVEGLLHSHPATDAVSLVSLANPARAVIRHASYDPRFVRERLDSLAATQASTDVEGGLNLVLDILRSSPAAPENRFVYLVSDFSSSTWKVEDPASSSAALTGLRRLADHLPGGQSALTLISIADEAVTNVAITRLSLESPMLGPGVPVRLGVEVTNYGTSTARGWKLATHRTTAPSTLDRRLTELPPIEPGAKTFGFVTTVFDTAGVHGVEARLIGPAGDPGSRYDALEDDDRRFLSVEARTASHFLLVDGRPGVNPLSGQSGFLATALSPQTSAAETTLIQVRTVSDSEFPAEDPFAYDLIALCNVARLTGQQWKQLEQFVINGGGLMVFTGDQIVTDNYNQYGFAAGRGVLPARFGPARRFDEREALGFKIGIPPHAVVVDFEGEPTSGFHTAMVTAYQSVEPESVRGDIALRYANDEPAMIISGHGRGRVALITTSANMDGNTLPAKGDYVTFVLNTVGFLAPKHGQHRNLMVGDTLREPLTAAESSLPTRVTLGDGTTIEGRIMPIEGRLALEFGPAERAGLYALGVGSEVRAAAVNIDPAESDLRSVTEDEMMKGLNRPFRWIGKPDGLAGKPSAAIVTELATITAYAVIVLLIAETWLAMKFGAARRPARSSGGSPSAK